MTGVARMVDLFPHEKLRLWRRRGRVTRQAAAHKLRRPLTWVEQAELGRRTITAADVPWFGSLDLADHERCVIYRTRAGRTQASVAAELRVSRLWVCRMERGLEKCDDLLWYWEQ